jgi:hypothetical protein
LTDRLHTRTRRDLGVRKNDEVRRRAFGETFERKAHRRRTEHDRLQSRGLRHVDLPRERRVNARDRIRIEQCKRVLPAAHCFRQQRFQARIDGDDREEAVLCVFSRNVPRERRAHAFGEKVDVFAGARCVGKRLEDHHEIAHGNAFAQEILQDALDLADREQSGNEFVDDDRIVRLDVVDGVAGHLRIGTRAVRDP